MKRKEIEADQMPGQDSFLDVITNIVGILILLVLIVGLRTSRAVHATSQRQSAERAGLDSRLQEAVHSAASGERGIQDLIQRVGNTRQEVVFREQERNALTTMVAEGEQEIKQWRESLNASDQRDFDLRRQIADAQIALDDLTREQIGLLSQETSMEEIKCEPTPIARAVTGKEVHILLADEHVAVIPFDALMDAAKEDAVANIWRLRQDDEMERSVGPIDGFRMKYFFVNDEVVGRSEAGNVVAGRIPSFSHCWIVPLTTPAGEPASEAMQPQSDLNRYLQGLRPDGTTVTIWTYPGNYEQLRTLKRWIRQIGFTIAVRPLPKGVPVGASRNGTTSVSE
jgi:hypothetical protein